MDSTTKTLMKIAFFLPIWDSLYRTIAALGKYLINL